MYIRFLNRKTLLAAGAFVLLLSLVAFGTILFSYGGAILTSTRHPAEEFQIPETISYIENYNVGPEISAPSFVLLENSTGTVLYSKNEHARRPPASTTKILTALLAVENGRLTDKVRVSERAAWTAGSSVKLKAGQIVTMEDLLHGLLLESGNDAAAAIAEHLAGTIENFTCMMNRRAAELGARDSNFENPHGLDDPYHYSSAIDLALITRVALMYPTIEEIVRKKTYQAATLKPGMLQNTNRLLWEFEGASGVKTGTTDAAGRCLIASAERDGRELIAVVLDSKDRYSDTERLLNFGFDKFNLLVVAKDGQKLAQVPIKGGLDPLVWAIPEKPLSVSVRNSDIGKMEVAVEIAPVSAPVKIRQSLGKLAVKLDGKIIATVGLMAPHNIPRKTPLTSFLRWAGQKILKTNPPRA